MTRSDPVQGHGRSRSAERERVVTFGRLENGLRQAGDWYAWGPYLSERQWGTVREGYSPGGTAWEYLPHDHARSRAYRWGEDGLAGFSDVEGRLCLGLALWNGRDPILKERIFGLTGNEGNHGEDAKEYWWYLDALPSHAWNRWRYPPTSTSQASWPTGRRAGLSIGHGCHGLPSSAVSPRPHVVDAVHRMTGSAITSIQVAGLFISPGHNFIGHHGRPPGEHPIVAVDRVECVAGRGVRGDRFFDHQPDFKGQVTFFAVETFEALARELGLNDARPELTRRNVLTRGRPEDGRDRGSGQPHAQGILTDEEYAAANAKALAL